MPDGCRAFDAVQPIEALGQILHVQPPAPSTLRHDLDGRHDELCRRLLAKEPDDRFQSATEVLGALRLLQPDTSKALPDPMESSPRGRVGLRRYVWAVIFVLVLTGAVLSLSRWFNPILPSAPADARRWYQRGTDALHEGAFQSATSALEQAVRIFPDYAVAYARLAEARAELDDERGAQRALLSVADRLPDESRLPTDDRLRLVGVRSLVLRDLDAAVRAYQELVAHRPADPGAWLDLGRAQEAAAHLGDARASYERSVTADRQYTAAHLRLGILAAAEGRREQSLGAYAEAERLYKALSRPEGEAEVLIRRGSLLDALGDFRGARAALEASHRPCPHSGQSISRGTRTNASEQRDRVEGRLGDAERLASDAVVLRSPLASRRWRQKDS